MKTKNVIALVIFAVVMLGVWKFRQWREAQLVRSHGGIAMGGTSDQPLTKAQAVKLQRDSARAALAASITNDVVGWHRTIRTSDFLYDDDWHSWVATAEIEFINRLGGIERTNCYWKFKPSGREAYSIRIPADEYVAILDNSIRK